MSIHNEAKINEIAKTVIMPGDPLRAKYISENFLNNYKLVNSVRGIYAYTGNYKNKTITVMASGMGMPSMGIYCYELYKFYNVENIIRIGSCGGYTEDLDIFDLAIFEKSYTEGNFSLALNNVEEHIVESDSYINEKLEEAVNKLGYKVKRTNVDCIETFDWYNQDFKKFYERIPKDLGITCAEMETFALFYTAKVLGKRAACIATVVDSQYYKKQVSAEEREKGVNRMVEVALEAAITL